MLGLRIRRVGILAAVPNDAVIVDDVVESGTECVARLVVGSGVVVFGWIGQAGTAHCQQQPARNESHKHNVTAASIRLKPNLVKQK